MAKIEIDKDRELNPGDVVLLHFKAPGGTWIKAGECAMVEYRLEKRKDFTITMIDYMQPGKVLIEVEIQKTNPEPITIAIIVVVILGAMAGLALAVGWMFEKAELVSKTPAAKVLSVTALIIAGLMLVAFLKKGKVDVG